MLGIINLIAQCNSQVLVLQFPPQFRAQSSKPQSRMKARHARANSISHSHEFEVRNHALLRRSRTIFQVVQVRSRHTVDQIREFVILYSNDKRDTACIW